MKKILSLILILILIICGAQAAPIKAKTNSGARVYKSPRTSAASLSVPSGKTVTVSSVKNGWATVHANGKTAYMKTSALSPVYSTKKEKATAFALMQVGKPYGYNAPSNFNCSSLVSYCFGKAGINVNGEAKDIANNGMLKVTSSFKVGDILCFAISKSGVCDHVGIYCGNNYFVEASSGARKVRINTLDSYYRSKLMFAKR